ncbi:24960_t:CDS:1, partial [Racocetra persica]
KPSSVRRVKLACYRCRKSKRRCFGGIEGRKPCESCCISRRQEKCSLLEVFD